MTGNPIYFKILFRLNWTTAARGEFDLPLTTPGKLSSVLIIDLFLLIKLIFVKLIIFLINVSN